MASPLPSVSVQCPICLFSIVPWRRAFPVLSDSEMVPVGTALTGISCAVTFHMRWTSTVRSLYFIILSVSSFFQVYTAYCHPTVHGTFVQKNFTVTHFTSRHFKTKSLTHKSRQFTSHHVTYLHSTSTYSPLLVTTFLALFLNVFSLQRKDASKPAGIWIITYICSLIAIHNFPIMVVPTQAVCI